jgi:hypothetical protein
MNRKFSIAIVTLVLIASGIILYAYSGTWNKTDLEFKIKIDPQTVYRSVYGESPTFAIWIEAPESGQTQTVYVTRRAAEEDWEGKSEVPAAIPKWFEVRDIERESRIKLNNHSANWQPVTSPTPQPGYFTVRINVPPGSAWVCWIEVNLAGDYNETYREFDEETLTYDEYKTGQPPLLYKAEIIAEEGNRTEPEIIGMSVIDPEKRTVMVQPLRGITTAKDIFEEIIITVEKPKPRILH